MLKMVLAELARRVDGVAGVEVAGLSSSHRAVHLTSRWKGRAVFAVFAAGEAAPSLVIKIDIQPTHKSRLHAEFAALTELGGHPRIQGRVPVPVALFDVGNRCVLAQTGIPGVPLNVVLRRRLRVTRRRFSADQDRVLGWLADLQDVGRLDRVPFNAEVALSRMQATLQSRSGGAASFLRAMTRQAGLGLEMSLPATAGHGDLGPSNCLISSAGQVGVIDWEGGVGLRSPLVDIVVFLHHYARALSTQRHAGAGGAFRRAFLADGWVAELTASGLHAQLRRLGVSPEGAPLLVAATIADLACGETRSVHEHRPASRRHWAMCLELFADGHQRSLLGRP